MQYCACSCIADAAVAKCQLCSLAASFVLLRLHSTLSNQEHSKALYRQWCPEHLMPVSTMFSGQVAISPRTLYCVTAVDPNIRGLPSPNGCTSNGCFGCGSHFLPAKIEQVNRNCPQRYPRHSIRRAAKSPTQDPLCPTLKASCPNHCVLYSRRLLSSAVSNDNSSIPAARL